MSFPTRISSRRITRWGMIAVAAGLAGLIASPQVLPVFLQAPLVIFLVFVGPGAAVRNWIFLEAALGAVLVPAIGIATVILLTTLLAAIDLWNPTAMLVGLSLAVGAAGLTRLPRRSRRSLVRRNAGVAS